MSEDLFRKGADRQAGREEANKAVAKLLAFLDEASAVDVRQFSEEQSKAYISSVCSAAALAIATLPAVQEAMFLARFDLTAEQRYSAIVSAVAGAFGFKPENSAAR